MAGGKITRIVKGSNTIECETWKVYTNEFTVHANDGSYFTADNGTIFGEPKDPPPPNKYFIKGWWTDKEDNPIKDARILNVVRFHVQTQNIENPSGKSIDIELYEHDYSIPIGLFPYFFNYSTDDHIRIMRGKKEVTQMWLDQNGKGYIEINLDWGLNNMFNEETLGFNEENDDLELYFNCRYLDQEETLPDNFSNYLKVKRSEQNLFIQPACAGYNFPEIRTYDGNIVVFKEDIIELDENNEALEPIKDYYSDKIKGKALESLGEKSDNLRRVIAVKQLKKGKLVTNTGLERFRKNVYLKNEINNLGEEVQVVRASNMGWKKDGKLVTTKGISQIDYFENIGFANKTLKASKELLNVFDFLDLIGYMSGNGKPDFIPTGFAPLDLVIQLIGGQVMAEFRELHDGLVNQLLEDAKDKGVADVKSFIEMIANLEENGDKKYNLLEVNQNIYNKLIQGEIKMIQELNNIAFKEKTNNKDSFNIYILWK
ncbi:hypothetical protein [Chishuiella sp.]|uniref:hypothetical protein n=1 Tax=Chishuiella sp. TaxID=1969467 RepID=UPI0028B1A4BC|nr:hypothetical protein [Chishuiella sp.]